MRTIQDRGRAMALLLRDRATGLHCPAATLIDELVAKITELEEGILSRADGSLDGRVRLGRLPNE